MRERSGARVTKPEVLFTAVLALMLLGTGALLMPTEQQAGSTFATSRTP